MEGRQLGPYLVESPLGSGGMGSVWRARVVQAAAGLAPGTPVALKVIHRQILSRHGAVMRFLREAELGRRVRHPNVVGAIDAGSADVDGSQQLYLVMELVEGRTLRMLLDELGAVPEPLVREIAVQVADGLAAIHAAGIVHRDLKPENLLLTPDHKVRIMDLGIARLVEESFQLTQTGEFVGSLYFAAPEHLRGGRVGPPSDLYSLGVTLYELVTGTNPFAFPDPGRVVGAHLNDVPPRADEGRPDVSPFLAEILATLLAKEPAARFPDAHTLRGVIAAGESSTWWAERAPRIREQTDEVPRIPVGRTTPLVGRDHELAALRQGWTGAVAGHGSTILLEGEAGIGKTRLVDAFLSELRGQDAHVLYGAFLPTGGGNALADAVTGFIGASPAESALASYLTGMQGLVPAFAAYLRHEARPAGSEPLSAQGIHAAMCRLMRGLAERRPVVWVVDDLHFADPLGRQIVLSMARAAPGHRVLLVAAARPGLPPDELAHLGRAGDFRRVGLGRLSPREVIELLRIALHSETVADRLGGKIAYKSDGVPYFVVELLQELHESEILRRLPDGSYETTREVADLEVPSAVRDLVRGRLTDLSDDERAILDVAAVQGFEFDADLIARVREMKRVVVLERLAGLQRRSGLVHGGGGRNRFDHHQVQEVLYDEMLPELREEYHALVAEAVAARDGAGEPSPEAEFRIAWHHLRGNRPQACAASIARVVQHLVELFRHDAVVDLARRALAVPGLVDGTRREELLYSLASSFEFTGRRSEERAALDESLRLADGSADPLRQARARRRLAWHLLGVSDLANARPLLEEALILSAGDPRELTAVTGQLGSLALESSRWDEARSLFERQLALARETGARAEEGNALGNLGILLKRLGRYEDARRSYEADLLVARSLGDRRGEAQTTCNLGALFAETGSPDDARARYEQALSIAGEIGDRRIEASATGNLGNVWRRLGRFADALSAYERHAALSREIGDRRGETVAFVNIGETLATLGDMEGARATFSACLDAAREVGSPLYESYARHGLGEVAERCGDLDGAVGSLSEALAIRRSVNAPRPVAESLLALGRVHAAAARPDAARTSLDEALAMARSLGAAELLTRATCLLATLPGVDPSDAVRALHEFGGRLRPDAAIEARHAAWRATNYAAHLAEAKRLLAEITSHVPLDRRSAMVTNVPLHRAVAEA
jgi:tetratricopeptide (TPR) repeat protein